MEFIIIDGERIAIPREVVSEGREAVAAWVKAQVAKRGAPAPVAEPETPVS